MTTPVSATREPIERSIPAVMMTNVCPTPRMQLYEICSSTVTKLRGFKNSPCAAALTIPIKIATIATNTVLRSQRFFSSALKRRLPWRQR